MAVGIVVLGLPALVVGVEAAPVVLDTTDDAEAGVEAADDEAIADSSKVGRSKISLSRSMFLASRSARFRRSSTSFSSLERLYLSEKLTARVSRLGISFRKDEAEEARSGSVERKEVRWVDEATRAVVERAESDCNARIFECVDCERVVGSSDVTAFRDKVVSRERYFDVAVLLGWEGRRLDGDGGR